MSNKDHNHAHDPPIHTLETRPGLKHACVELAVDRVKKWEVEWNVVGLGTNHDAPFPSPDRCGGVSGSFFSSTTAVTRERPRK